MSASAAAFADSGRCLPLWRWVRTRPSGFWWQTRLPAPSSPIRITRR